MKLKLHLQHRFFFFIIFILLVASCDLTPVVHKKIIDAQNFVAAQEYKKAKYIYEDLLKYQVPASLRVKILIQLAQIYSLQENNHERGYDLYKEARELAEMPADGIVAEEGMATIEYYAQKDYTRSSESFKKLLDFRPKLTKFNYYQEMFSLSLFKKGDLEKAYNAFSINLNCEDAEYKIRAIYYQGLIKFQEGEWQKAIDLWYQYLKVEKRKENIVQIKFMMANAYETIGELKLAYNLYYSLQGEYPNTEILKKRMNGVFSRKVARKR